MDLELALQSLLDEARRGWARERAITWQRPNEIAAYEAARQIFGPTEAARLFPLQAHHRVKDLVQIEELRGVCRDIDDMRISFGLDFGEEIQDALRDLHMGICRRIDRLSGVDPDKQSEST